MKKIVSLFIAITLFVTSFCAVASNDAKKVYAEEVYVFSIPISCVDHKGATLISDLVNDIGTDWMTTDGTGKYVYTMTISREIDSYFFAGIKVQVKEKGASAELYSTTSIGYEFGDEIILDPAKDYKFIEVYYPKNVPLSMNYKQSDGTVIATENVTVPTGICHVGDDGEGFEYEDFNNANFYTYCVDIAGSPAGIPLVKDGESHRQIFNQWKIDELDSLVHVGKNDVVLNLPMRLRDNVQMLSASITIDLVPNYTDLEVTVHEFNTEGGPEGTPLTEKKYVENGIEKYQSISYTPQIMEFAEDEDGSINYVPVGYKV